MKYFAFLSLLFILSEPPEVYNNYWQADAPAGAVWNDAENWSRGVPSSRDRVIFQYPQNTTDEVIVDASILTKKILISKDCTFSGPGTVTVSPTSAAHWDMAIEVGDTDAEVVFDNEVTVLGTTDFVSDIRNFGNLMFNGSLTLTNTAYSRPINFNAPGTTTIAGDLHNHCGMRIASSTVRIDGSGTTDGQGGLTLKGGRLELNRENALGGGGAVFLNSGTLVAGGYHQGSGTLDLAASDVVIDMDNKASVFTFDDSSGTGWGLGNLMITNAGSSVVRFAEPGLTSSQVEQIVLDGQVLTSADTTQTNGYLYITPWVRGNHLSGAVAAITELAGTDRVDYFVAGVKLFTDRTYTLTEEVPDYLSGSLFLRSSINTVSVEVVKSGVLTVLTPESQQFSSSRVAEIEAQGFIRITESELFQLFGDQSANQVRVYQKNAEAGERFDFGKWTVVVGFTDTKAEISVLAGNEELDCIDRFVAGVKLFSDAGYTLTEEVPNFLKGSLFLRSSINTVSVEIVKSGILTVLTPESQQFSSSRVVDVEAQGFIRITEPELFQLFGDLSANKVRVYQKNVEAGERVEFGKWSVILGFFDAWGCDWSDARTLYNGIRLPGVWPPEDMDPTSTEPMPVPYLEESPSVIPITVGRQLLVDDFLIETTDLTRTFHQPEKYAGNPVLQPETALERDPVSQLAVASPKSGGLWWDPDEQIFKLWYEAGWLRTICYATSTNGIDWGRPELDAVFSESNQVLPDGLRADSWTVVRDWDTNDPDSKYKIFVRDPGGAPEGAMCFESPDGIDFGDYTMSGVMGDRSTMFYNPFRQKWIFSLRAAFTGRGRARHYWEADDFMTGNQWLPQNMNGSDWQYGQPVVWTGADELDPPDPVVQLTPQLYNLDAVAYESIMLGFYQIWRGPNNQDCLGVPKITELNFAYSRDGFHWDRPDRTTAIEASRDAGTWDRGYVQSLGNICVLRGDQIWFYYTGFAGDTNRPSNGMYANGAMGIATLRRDGFASMESSVEGELTTRPITFSGKHLFVNADVLAGSLQAEVLDQNGNVIQPFTLQNSVAFSGNSTLQQMMWNGGSDLSVLAGQPVRFRFKVSNGAFYSFWVSIDETGRSDGYVAGGGPGYTGPTDTVGSAALIGN